MDSDDIKEKAQAVVIVYSDDNKVKFMYSSLEKALKTLVKIKYKVMNISLNKKRIKLSILAYIQNKYNVRINKEKIYIDSSLCQECKLKQYKKEIPKIKMLTDKNIYTFTFDIDDILKDDSQINGHIRFSLEINGNEINYKIGHKDKKIKKTAFYYVPIKSIFVKDFAIHLRRSNLGSLILIKRKKEQIENTLRFKLLESKIVSLAMCFIGKIAIRHRKKKVNIFYEKFASKAEEGAYDLFLLFEKHKNTKNYFVLDEKSKDYEALKSNKNVLKKFSFKYYMTLYSANNLIATEAPRTSKYNKI